MIFKALKRKSGGKDFFEITAIADTHILFSSKIPILMENSTTMKFLKKYHSDVDLSDYELVKLEVTEIKKLK
jgi:hypothetical protein